MHFLKKVKIQAVMPTNGGVPFASWRTSRQARLFMKVYFVFVIGHIMAAKGNYGSKYNTSWRGGDSIL